jgi:hypothetical protein
VVAAGEEDGEARADLALGSAPPPGRIRVVGHVPFGLDRHGALGLDEIEHRLVVRSIGRVADEGDLEIGIRRDGACGDGGGLLLDGLLRKGLFLLGGLRDAGEAEQRDRGQHQHLAG